MKSLSHPLKLASFLTRGRVPFSTGYGAFKDRAIQRTLRTQSFTDDRLPAGFGLGLDERIIEYPWLFSRLPADPGTLLDAGSVLNHEYILEQPSLVAKQLTIVTMAPEHDCFWRRRISYVYDDLRSMCFRDAYFDWVVCLSTLEHVGLDNSRFYGADTPVASEPDSYLSAVREFSRLLRPGGTLYLSVPYGEHRDFGWLQTFDAQMLDAVRAAFQPRSWQEHIFVSGQNGWTRTSRAAAASATYWDRHANPRYSPRDPAAAEAVACIEIRK